MLSDKVPELSTCRVGTNPSMSLPVPGNFQDCTCCASWKLSMPQSSRTVFRREHFLILLPLLVFNPVMPRFAEQVEVAIEALSANVPQPFEENEFIDASRLVYDGVRDIRKAVLMIRVCRAAGEWKLGFTGRCHG